tara:strand:- start:82 stop:327 length:246 start_codon:yes stop_codon:yes gene_type:complete
MNSYIEACCELPPLDTPSYCEESDLWGLWFAETSKENCPWAYSVLQDQELVCVHFETQEEAQETFNHYTNQYNETNEENDS